MATPRKPRGRSVKQIIETTQREGEALRLRAAGYTFDRIAEALGYHDASGAAKAVRRALAATIQEPADELRRLETERLDLLWRALMPKVERGVASAVKECVGISDRRARMLGLDAPQRVRQEVITRDAFAEAIRELEAEVAELEGEAEEAQT